MWNGMKLCETEDISRNARGGYHYHPYSNSAEVAHFYLEYWKCQWVDALYYQM